MSIPHFNEYGFLPPGEHECSLVEIGTRFGIGDNRRRLFQLLQTFVTEELRSRYEEPIYVDGSFATDKESPNDVDVTLDMRNASDARQACALLFMTRNQKRICHRYGVHFWVSVAGGYDFTRFFQYVGPKVAHMGLSISDMKGILRVNNE